MLTQTQELNAGPRLTVRQSQMRRDEWRLTDPVYLFQRYEIYQDYLETQFPFRLAQAQARQRLKDEVKS